MSYETRPHISTLYQVVDNTDEITFKYVKPEGEHTMAPTKIYGPEAGPAITEDMWVFDIRKNDNE